MCGFLNDSIACKASHTMQNIFFAPLYFPLQFSNQMCYVKNGFERLHSLKVIRCIMGSAHTYINDSINVFEMSSLSLSFIHSHISMHKCSRIIKSHFESKPITFDTDYSIGFCKIEQTMFLPYSLLFSQQKKTVLWRFLIGQGKSEMDNEIETRTKKNAQK